MYVCMYVCMYVRTYVMYYEHIYIYSYYIYREREREIEREICNVLEGAPTNRARATPERTRSNIVCIYIYIYTH